MSIIRLTTISAVIALALAALNLTSCNKDTSTEDDPNYQRGTELVVTRFYLMPNMKVMDDLDSVYFAIDLNKGVIYNADSLPVGTPVNKLVPSITIPKTVQRAEIVEQSADGSEEVVHNYLDSPTDTIDFTKNVTLRLSTLNETVSRIYQLKVNVHKMNPDSLYFDMEARTALPSRMANPKKQKTVSRDSTVYTFVQESDDTYTLSQTRHLESGEWVKRAVKPGFEANVRSLSATDDAFYMLGADGTLHASADGVSWHSVSEAGKWISIIGAFNNSVQGVKNVGGKLMHTQYPAGTYRDTELESGFPYLYTSNMAIYTTKWSSLPLGLITGGYDGTKYTGDTWAFDGTSWISISDKGMPAVYGGTMIPYYAYLRTTTMWLFNEYSVWLFIGGCTPDGKVNQTVYISYDNGVNWKKAPEAMQLPKDLDNLLFVDHAVQATPLEANFSPTNWKSFGRQRTLTRKLPYVINGYDITWNCPFIYLCGGHKDADSAVNPWIYRGVINRMRFKPLI